MPLQNAPLRSELSAIKMAEDLLNSAKCANYFEGAFPLPSSLIGSLHNPVEVYYGSTRYGFSSSVISI